jgi:hypothetical protein
MFNYATSLKTGGAMCPNPVGDGYPPPDMYSVRHWKRDNHASRAEQPLSDRDSSGRVATANEPQVLDGGTRTRGRDALSSLTSWSFVAVRQRTADATSFQWLIAADLRNAKSMPQYLLGGELGNRLCTIWVIPGTFSFDARLRLFAARSPFFDLRLARVRTCRLLLTGPLQGVGLK